MILVNTGFNIFSFYKQKNNFVISQRLRTTGLEIRMVA